MHVKLFVVATPIGNLDDMTVRAREVLSSVDLIAAEDTRHSGVLLQHFGIKTPLIAYHDHNETEASAALVEKMLSGTEVALISDAGTPLISDPGYRLVDLAHEKGVQVIPIPGASAIIAGLSVSGLPTDRFLFLGFLPAKVEARRKSLEEVCAYQETLVFYESRHRIQASIRDMVSVFGEDRPVTIGRELTKKFEQIRHATLGEIFAEIEAGDITVKGEFVVMVRGATAPAANYEHVHLLKALLSELPPRKAAGVASKITGESKKLFYDLSLSLKSEK